MLNSIITSQTRIKLLLKFFLNSRTVAHLRGLEAEFGESTNGIRVELNRLEYAKLLVSERRGNRKFYRANTSHPLFNDIHNIIIKETGIDTVIERVLSKTGKILKVFLTGSFARGINGKVIDLIIIGENIDGNYLNLKVKQAGEITGRLVRYSLISPDKAESELRGYDEKDLLVLWDGEMGEWARGRKREKEKTGKGEGKKRRR